MLKVQLIRSRVHVDSNSKFSASSERWNSLKLHRSVGPFGRKIREISTRVAAPKAPIVSC